MSFIWPPMLAALALIPLGVGMYAALDRRRRRRAAGFGGLGIGKAATRRPAGLRGRIPAALFLIGFTVMTLALARPQGVVGLPTQEGTVILAFDVSGSMAADDLKPTRMEAAKAAAQEFVKRQRSGVIIGVVAFSDGGLAVQAPTSDQDAVLAAINRLSPNRGTSVGQGILVSLNTIAVSEAGPNVDYYSNRSPAPTATPAPVPPGTHASAAIVLLTDGENNERPDPLAVAQVAANQGVRVHTVGIGSEAGTIVDLNGFRVHTRLDPEVLRQIAQITGGTYYAAATEQDLHAIYDTLDTRLVVKTELIEVTALFAGAAMLILAIGGLCSLAWLGRLP